MSIEKKYAKLPVPAGLLLPHDLCCLYIPRIWSSMALPGQISPPQVPGLRLVRRRGLRAVLERATEADSLPSGIWGESHYYPAFFHEQLITMFTVLPKALCT